MSATAQQKDFTHLSAQSVQTIAEAFGIVISDDVAKALAPDVEYRLRDIIQEALKVTKRSRRTVLTTEVFDLQICFTSSVCLFVCACASSSLFHSIVCSQSLRCCCCCCCCCFNTRASRLVHARRFKKARGARTTKFNSTNNDTKQQQTNKN